MLPATEKPRLAKRSKDHLVSRLTAGLPTLSVRIEDRRQVFVESDYDVNFYEACFKLVRNFIDSDISLHFISAGGKKGGSCSLVQSMVSSLEGSGAKSVRGIIDWDQKNKQSRNVFVVGYGIRDSMENINLDPVAIGLYLLREKFIKNKDVPVPERLNFVEVAQSPPQILQQVADYVCNHVFNRFSIERADSLLVKYVNGVALALPTNWVQMDGHELENKVHQAFAPFEKFEKRVGALRKEILTKVWGDCPHLIPYEVKAVFEQIQQS